jgi:hypothetical protein
MSLLMVRRRVSAVSDEASHRREVAAGILIARPIVSPQIKNFLFDYTALI